jgi:hypothetical protein
LSQTRHLTPNAASWFIPQKLGIFTSDNFVVLLLLLLLSIVTFLVPRGYGTNDNFGIIENARSGFSTPYCGVFMTTSLHWLYHRWPNTPWFGINLYLAILTVSAIAARAILTNISNTGPRILLLLILCTTITPYLIRPDYSAASILLGGIAIWLMINGNGRISPLTLLIAVLIGVWAYSIRRMGLYGALILLSPPVFVLSCKRWRESIRSLGFGLFVIACFILLDRAAYARETANELKSFSSFNSIRAKIDSSPYFTYSVPDSIALSQIGWTQNDFWIFSHWLYVNEIKFNKHSLQRLENLIQQHPVSESMGKAALKFLGQYWFATLLLIIITLALLALSGSEICLPIILSLAWSISVALALAFVWQFPPRVGLPFISGMALALVMSPLLGRVLPAYHLLFPSFLVGIVVCCASRPMLRNSRENLHRERLFREEVRVLGKLPPDAIVLVEGGVMEFDWSDPLTSVSISPSVIQTGMGIYSPLFYQVINRLGMAKAQEIVPKLQKHGYLLSYPETAARFSVFAFEDFGIRIKTIPVKSLGTGAELYEIVEGASS